MGGRRLSADPTALGEFLEEWLSRAKPYLRPKTWSQYSQVVHQHISPYLGSYDLAEVGPGDIQELYGHLLSQGRSLFTLRITHAILHRALRQAGRWGLLDRNPCDGVDKPKPRRREIKTLTADQIRQLLEAVEGTQFEALYYLAVTTGLRQGELLGLVWSDVDWSVPCLKVQRQLQRITGQGLVFAEPKTTAGRRVVVLGTTAFLKFRQYLQRQADEREESGKAKWRHSDLIFPSSRGIPMGPRNLLRHFSITLKMANLPSARFHDLRQTAASLMLIQGTHPKVVQERLGHSQISVTLDTYSHVLPSLQAEAAEKIDELIERERRPISLPSHHRPSPFRPSRRQRRPWGCWLVLRQRRESAMLCPARAGSDEGASAVPLQLRVDITSAKPFRSCPVGPM